MEGGEKSNQLTQQVWNTTEMIASHLDSDQQQLNELAEQMKIDSGVLKSLLIPIADGDDDLGEILSVYSFSEDEDFGEFKTRNAFGDDESWVSINYEKVENMESAVADLASYANKPTLKTFKGSNSTISPPPSPLPRGYLRSTQDVEAFLHPMDSSPEVGTLGDLSMFESSSYSDYEPLIKTDSCTTSSTQAHHDTSTKRMWSLGKTALKKVDSLRQDAGKQAKQAAVAWQTGFVDQKQEVARIGGHGWKGSYGNEY